MSNEIFNPVENEILKPLENEQLELKGSYNRALIKLIITATFGIIIFFVNFNGAPVFNYLYKDIFLNKIIGSRAAFIVGIIPPLMLVGNIFGKNFAKEGSFLYNYFKDDKPLHFAMYLISTIFSAAYYFHIDLPILNLIWTPEVGDVMIGDTLHTVIAISPIAMAVLPLLASYGLLHIVGGLMEPLMRPIWKTPGKSALDMVTSIVGAAVVGILLTSNLYKRKEYTNKESFFIATNFSLNSVGYCTFLITYCGLISHFGPMFIIYFLLTFVMSIIIVRIPPISKYPDVYVDGEVQTEEMRQENLHYSKAQLKKALDAGVKQADGSGNVFKDILFGFLGGCKVVTGLVPMMMCIGCIGLIISNYTPIMGWLGAPLTPLLTFLHIEEAGTAAQAILLGGVDLFLPSVMIAPVASEATRFFVCIVSLLQILYISETILPVYFFGIPCKFMDIVILFIERTLIAIPLVAAVTHIMYTFVW